MKSEITRFAQKSVLKFQAKSPQILFVAGVAGTIGTVVLSSRATLKANVVLQEHRTARADLEEWRDTSPTVTEQQYKEVVVDQVRQTSIAFVKLYAPTAILGVASIAALTKSHNILVSRNNALAATVAGLHNLIANYRARVVADQGEQKDLEYLHGTIDKEITTTNSKGVEKTKVVKVLDPDGETPYSVYYDAKNPTWDRDPGYNANFLQNQEKWANDQLQKHGHLFLNEVFDLLKFPRTEAGQVVGWIYDTKDGADCVVDFGFRKNGEFVAGFDPDVWLDFNVDGEILGLLEKHAS